MADVYGLSGRGKGRGLLKWDYDGETVYKEHWIYAYISVKTVHCFQCLIIVPWLCSYKEKLRLYSSIWRAFIDISLCLFHNIDLNRTK